MTEDEAKTKWCPKAFVGDGESSGNRMWGKNGAPDSDCFCLASDCACWVWDSEKAMKENRQGHCGFIRLGANNEQL